jgi:hypothetical protein
MTGKDILLKGPPSGIRIISEGEGEAGLTNEVLDLLEAHGIEIKDYTTRKDGYRLLEKKIADLSRKAERLKVSDVFVTGKTLREMSEISPEDIFPAGADL